ncbi:hypothetical protein MKW94_000739 [Papaver nudicaule]|uniref:Uncharacterized protein n=1 Tax=Papaver nudicaule TaxID=74823 RepID=A0AA41UXJ9_PAPNU|nr:hypothetical protein [Papaver nudicaule]
MVHKRSVEDLKNFRALDIANFRIVRGYYFSNRLLQKPIKSFRYFICRLNTLPQQRKRSKHFSSKNIIKASPISNSK